MVSRGVLAGWAPHARPDERPVRGDAGETRMSGSRYTQRHKSMHSLRSRAVMRHGELRKSDRDGQVREGTSSQRKLSNGQ